MNSVKMYSPLVLAYIGDSVYEVFVRNQVLKLHPSMPAYKLHRETVKYVKAAAQAKSAYAVENILNEEELGIYKRGRNAKSATVPKNADVTDYRCATGFEALMGYLYLSGENERLEQLMQLSFDAV